MIKELEEKFSEKFKNVVYLSDPKLDLVPKTCTWFIGVEINCQTLHGSKTIATIKVDNIAGTYEFMTTTDSLNIVSKDLDTFFEKVEPWINENYELVIKEVSDLYL